jgi:hypothetical protein
VSAWLQKNDKKKKKARLEGERYNHSAIKQNISISSRVRVRENGKRGKFKSTGYEFERKEGWAYLGGRASVEKHRRS